MTDHKDTLDALESTIEDMISSDYNRRFVAEYNQLVIRYASLIETIYRYKGHPPESSDFVPVCNVTVLENQAAAMLNYIQVLRYRSTIEHIKL